MWVLSCDGGFLEHKRVWLRPGQRYLFGRVKSGSIRDREINHSTISRKHLVLEVKPVQEGDGTRLDRRSVIVASDEGSKTGTFIDKELVKKDSRELKHKEHIIYIGKYPYPLEIRWHPVVLTVPVGSKKANDRLVEHQSQLEELDIKTIGDYRIGKTTHVLQSKRNTVKGLQALVDAKYIVSPSYIEDIKYAAAPSDMTVQESLCPLEIDFDSAWPDPVAYLPAPKSETTSKEDEAYAPDPARAHVFEHFTFIFCDHSKFDDFQPVITTGHGKALLYELEHGKTTAANIYEKMKQVAGRRGLGGPDGGSHVGFMQLPRDGEHDEWVEQLEEETCRISGQKVVEYSRFLDAILRKDAASLIQEFPRSSEESTNLPEENTPVRSSPSPPEPAREESLQGASRRRGGRPVDPTTPPLEDAERVSLWGISERNNGRLRKPRPPQQAELDEEPPQSATKRRRINTQVEPHSQQSTLAEEKRPSSTSNYPRGNRSIEIAPLQPLASIEEEPSQSPPKRHYNDDVSEVTSQDNRERSVSLVDGNTRPSKRRRLRPFISKTQNFDDGFDANSIAPPPIEEKEYPELLERLPSALPESQSRSVPTEAADERPDNAVDEQPPQVEKEAEEEDLVSDLLPGAREMKRLGGRKRRTPTPRPEPESETRPKRPKLDLIEAAKQRREAEDKAVAERRRDEQTPSLQDADLAHLKNLAIVEDTVVPSSRKTLRSQSQPADRWRDEWNGRKNFKGFRRNGESASQRSRRVIVPLEEVKRKAFGLGDEFWSGREEDESREKALAAQPDSSHSRVSTTVGSVPEMDTMADVETETGRQRGGASVTEPASQSRSWRSTGTRTRKSQRSREIEESDSDEDQFRFRWQRNR